MIIFQPISVVPIFFKSGKRSFTKFFILKNNSHWIYFNQFSANTTIILPLLRNRIGRIFTISTLWLIFCFIFLVSRNSWKKNTNWKQVWNIREIDFFMLRSRKWKTICSDQWSRWSHEFFLHPLQKNWYKWFDEFLATYSSQRKKNSFITLISPIFLYVFLKEILMMI